MRILAVITARGRSVTLPRKNILPFCGKPLIAYSIDVALGARDAGVPIERLIVSTDDAEIADTSRRFGAEVPFIRPAALAQSDTPSLPVVQHAVAFSEQELALHYDWILLLQPTSPLRTKDDIVGAIAIAEQPDTTGVASITSAANSHPAKLKLISNGILKPYLGTDLQQPARQDFAFEVYKTNGAIYLTRRDVLMDQGSFYGTRPRPFIMPLERSIDIDTLLDFEMAEFLYRREVGGCVPVDSRA
jgi:CMP-N-acetylneuraminic acid synthetase